MANIDGMKLTLPDGSIFRGSRDLQLQVEHQRQFLLSGGNTVVGVSTGLFDDVGTGSGILQTPLASGHVGASSGSRVFEFRFTRSIASSESWGSASAGDPLLEQLGTLDAEVARANPDSLNPATLEWGPFSSTTSKYSAIPVIVQQISPNVDFERQSSEFEVGITLAETIDLSQEIDGANGPATADFTLSSPNATDDVPIAADTLGAGGRGTGEQQQGAETAQSALAEKNAASGSTPAPTSFPTATTPRDVTLTGAFRGASAADLADRLRSQYLNNPDVETVTLSTSKTGTYPITGTYTLGSGSSIDPVVPAANGGDSAGLYAFTLDLTQQ